MGSSFGKILRVSVFGESHGEMVGAVADGFPAGENIDMEAISIFLARRAGGRAWTTARAEPDEPRFVSGLRGNVTTGSPLCALIENKTQRSGDYENLKLVPRPSHADYTSFVKYGGFADGRGGGHFSGRLTAPLCALGAMAIQMLARRGVTIGAHLSACAGIEDARYDPLRPAFRPYADFPALDDAAGARMRAAIIEAASEGDSVGGVVECAATGLPVGLGAPLYEGVENRLCANLFGLGALRGVEFGDGFAAASMRGSAHNDAFCMENGAVRTRTNHAGGVSGGITNGMPLIFRAAFKPTPSIAREQESVDLRDGTSAALSIRGRHDPCVAVRAVPCVEAVCALTILDLMLEGI